jgi:hypothetical protein
MVGPMTGPWRTPQGSIAFTSVMGLVLLCLLLAGTTGSATPGGAAPAQGSLSTLAWTANGDDGGLSSLPPQAGSAREHHVLSLWPPLRGERQDEPAHLALLVSPFSDANALRDPQQLAHRTAGSRSPPLG